MPTTHKFFQDKAVLLLLSINFFLLCLGVVLMVSRIVAGSGSGYIVQYRDNVGVGAFKTGSLLDFIYFIVFAMLVVGFHSVLSFRTYHIRRQLSILLLSLSVVLLLSTIIVSNALLVLR